MTLQEAIKSGRPFRRKGWTDENWVKAANQSTLITIESILADDWELKPEEPKWRRAWIDVGCGSERIETSKCFMNDPVLLIDSRPVKALLKTLRVLVNESHSAFKHVVEVEQLLKESQ